MDTVKVKNNKGEILEVNFAHAIGVLLPQRNYSLIDEVLIDILNKPLDAEGNPTHENKDLDKRVSRKAITQILDGAEIPYSLSANKFQLLAILLQEKLLGVKLEA